MPAHDIQACLIKLTIDIADPLIFFGPCLDSRGNGKTFLMSIALDEVPADGDTFRQLNRPVLQEGDLLFRVQLSVFLCLVSPVLGPIGAN